MVGADAELERHVPLGARRGGGALRSVRVVGKHTTVVPTAFMTTKREDDDDDEVNTSLERYQPDPRYHQRYQR